VPRHKIKIASANVFILSVLNRKGSFVVELLASTLPEIMSENLLPIAPAILSLLLSFVNSLAKPLTKSLASLLE